MGRGLSITAFIISLTIFLAPSATIGLTIGIIATLLSAFAIVKSKEDTHALRSLAITGLIIGILSILWSLAVIFAANYIANSVKSSFR